MKANFGIYTCNPQTGEGGWGIKFVSVLGIETKEQAKELLKSDYPNFDSVILFNHICDMTDEEKQIFQSGKIFITE